MEQEYITRREHEEFARRMEAENERICDENNRQNKRLSALEDSVKDINKLALNIERMTASIQSMTSEIEKQGKRLESIEQKPAKKWDALVFGILGAIAAAIGAAIMSGVVH